MSGEAHEILPADLADRREAGRAPPLPIEAPLVRAVRELEALKAQVDSLLLLLEHHPGAGDLLANTVNSAVERMNGVSAAIWQFSAIRSCKGQG